MRARWLLALIALGVLMGCGGDDPEVVSAVQIVVLLEGEATVPEGRVTSLRLSFADSAGLGVTATQVPVIDNRVRLLPSFPPDPDQRFRYCLIEPAQIVDGATLEVLHEIGAESCFVEGTMTFDGHTLESREDQPAG